MVTTIEIPDNGPNDEPIIETGGSVLADTIAVLRHQRPDMTDAEFDDTVDDARRLITEVVRHYEADVASGEVGKYGSGVADPEVLVSASPIGLLYGRIQSGKTRAMVTSAAMAFDNGFRVVVVLTSDNTELVKQTAKRFGVLSNGGVMCIDSHSGDWNADRDHIRQELSHAGGLVVVCAKNARHLTRLRVFLESIAAGGHPAIVFDDEGDQATLDTTQSKRSRNPAAAVSPSRIHQQTMSVNHDAALGDSLRQVVSHSVYVQVTATPQALLLQGLENRPAFTVLIEPGGGYRGGDFFFSRQAVETGTAPLKFVEDSESVALHNPNVQKTPEGLELAIDTFCLAASLVEVRDGPGRTFTFLCQTSHKTVEHESADRLIRLSLKALLDAIRVGDHDRLAAARNELERSGTIEDADYSAAIRKLKTRLRSRHVALVNSKNDPLDVQEGLNFLTGGNILGRGLTLENLLVTYYLRAPRTPQQDTMWQQARMFGYRGHLDSLLRVFIPRNLADRFKAIADTERYLREQCDRYGQLSGNIAVHTAGRLRPTRGNVLPTNDIDAIRGGRAIHPHYPEYRVSELGSMTARIDSLIATQVLQGPLRDELKRQAADPRSRQLHEVPIKTLVELLKAVPTRAEEEAPELWNLEGLIAILHAKYGDSSTPGQIWIRESDRRNTGGNGRLPTGMHGRGVDDPALTNPDPTLMLFRRGVDSGENDAGWNDAPFWYPTLRLPDNEIWLVNSQ